MAPQFVPARIRVPHIVTARGNSCDPVRRGTATDPWSNPGACNATALTVGTVALSVRWSRRTDFTTRPGSDRPGKFGERDRDAMVCACVDAEFVVTAADVLHECVAAHDHGRGSEAFEAAHRPQAGLEPAVVALDPIVRVLLDVVACARSKLVNRACQ